MTASFHPLWQQPSRGTATQSVSPLHARNWAPTPCSPPPRGAGEAEGAGTGTGTGADVAAGVAATGVAGTVGSGAGRLTTGAVVLDGCGVCVQASAARRASAAVSVERGIDNAYL